MQRKARRIDPNGKRAAVLEAAMTLFRQNGYEKTSISEIARRADVAVGSVYRAFADKPALLAAIRDETAHRLAAVIEAGWADDRPPADRLRAMCRAVTAQARAELSAAAALPGSGLAIDGAPVVEALTGMITTGIGRGELRPVPLPETAGLLAHLIDMAVRTAIAAADPGASERSIMALEEILVRTLIIEAAPKRTGLTLWR